MSDPYVLAAHDWQLEASAQGGVLTALDWRGTPVLRRATVPRPAPTEAACFPLVPYCNRIANGRFRFDGAEYRLPPNMGDHPHSLHGVGWLRNWTLSALGGDRLELVLDHQGDADWPWRFAARQHIELAPGAVRMALELVNTDDRAMPAGLGFHPYFPLDRDTRLTFHADTLWDVDAEPLPTRPIAPDRHGDWSAGTAVSAPAGLIDNAYSDWGGTARIRQPGQTISISAQGARALHLYRPAASDFFCIEPVSHLPDAINRDPPFEMDRLAAGETLRLGMTLEIVPF